MIQHKDPISLKILRTQMFSNMLFAMVLYAMLIFVLHFVGVEITWDITMLFSIIASVSGVGYILTIKNPLNFLGFYPGIVMTIFLGLQFYSIKSYDLTVLYWLVFLPIQIKTIMEWKRSWMNVRADLDEYNEFKPKFLSTKKKALALGIFLLIVAVDLVVLRYVMSSELSLFAIITSAIVVSSSVLASYLLMLKKTDAWIYWIVYSVFGIIFAVLTANQFNLVLFIFFLFINSYTASAWIKMK